MRATINDVITTVNTRIPIANAVVKSDMNDKLDLSLPRSYVWFDVLLYVLTGKWYLETIEV